MVIVRVFPRIRGPKQYLVPLNPRCSEWIRRPCKGCQQYRKEPLLVVLHTSALYNYILPTLRLSFYIDYLEQLWPSNVLNLPKLVGPNVTSLTTFTLEIVMNELRRFKHSADFLANSSHIIESAAISAS